MGWKEYLPLLSGANVEAMKQWFQQKSYILQNV